MLLVVSSVIAVFFICMVVLITAVFARFHGNHDLALGQQHLKPIPIDKQACPYVEAMHNAAYNFELVNPDPFSTSDVDADGTTPQQSVDFLDPKQWPATKAHVDAAILELDRTIRLASPHLPMPVQEQLAVTHQQLHLGRIQLHEAKSWGDLAGGPASDIDTRGQTAFGNASDLIGMACGVHVGV